MSQDETGHAFDPNSPYHARPKLRQVRGFAVNSNGRRLLGISDTRQISDQIVVISTELGGVLPLIDGTRTPEEIAAAFGQGLGVEHVQSLVARLDQAGLLVGPVFEAMMAQVRADFDASAYLPPAATVALTDNLVNHRLGGEATPEQKDEMAAEVLRESLDQWIAQSLDGQQDTAFSELPKAIMVPHLDYPRGWAGYAAVWGRMRGGPRPDRIVILGTNHFGSGTGVSLCDKGYQTALGICPVDTPLLDALRKRLGPDLTAKAMEHRFDHEREHSIELQVPWIQHCLGPGPDGGHIPVLGILVHDPAVNQGESYDGQGLGLQPFVEALRLAIQDVGGRTLVVSSADLSHAGPMFGDEVNLREGEPEAIDLRNRIMAHDRAMLKHIMDGRPDDLITAMMWQQNPTRWCSVGNIVAAMKVVQATSMKLLRHAVAIDPEGVALVTCVGGVMETAGGGAKG